MSDIERFVNAQDNGEYDKAYKELRAGRKRSHWMWYIFPQFVGLGSTSMNVFYSINSANEAKAYLQHALLGPRLIACTQTVNQLHGRWIYDVFPHPDELKFFSCMTLFAEYSEADSVFHEALNKYFSGKRDIKTLNLIRETPENS